MANIKFILWKGMTIGQFFYRNKHLREIEYCPIENRSYSLITYHYDGFFSKQHNGYDIEASLDGYELNKIKEEMVRTYCGSTKEEIQKYYNRKVVEKFEDKYKDYFITKVIICDYSKDDYLNWDNENRLEIHIEVARSKTVLNECFVKRVIYKDNKNNFSYITSNMNEDYKCQSNVQYKPEDKDNDFGESNKTNSSNASQSPRQPEKQKILEEKHKYECSIFKDKTGKIETILYGKWNWKRNFTEGVIFKPNEPGGYQQRIEIGTFSQKDMSLEDGYSVYGDTFSTYKNGKEVTADRNPNDWYLLKTNDYFVAFFEEFNNLLNPKEFYCYDKYGRQCFTSGKIMYDGKDVTGLQLYEYLPPKESNEDTFEEYKTDESYYSKQIYGKKSFDEYANDAITFWIIVYNDKRFGNKSSLTKEMQHWLDVTIEDMKKYYPNDSKRFIKDLKKGKFKPN